MKTTILTLDDRVIIEDWVKAIQLKLNLSQFTTLSDQVDKDGYQKDIPLHIRKTIEYILTELTILPKLEQRNLVRCALLSTGQWALDCTVKFPSALQFRSKFADILQEYFVGLAEIQEITDTLFNGRKSQTVCLDVPAVGLNSALWEAQINQKPKLVVTSPPYPNVHVLYHRWQIKGRKETAAPFWIVDELDGHGASYYTMGSRTPTGLNNYFKSIEDSFSRIYFLLAEGAIIVQLLAFSNVEEQLPKYLGAMEHAGFKEVEHTLVSEGSSSRVWRQVPLRRWYASYKGDISSSHEVLLIHKRTP